MLSNLLMPEIAEMIENRRLDELRETLAEWPAPEISDLLENLDPEERIVVFRSLPKDRVSEVFSELNAESQSQFIEDLTSEEIGYLLEDLNPDDRTQLLEALPGEATQKLLNLLSPGALKEARRLLGYPDESVGRLMTPDYVAVQPEWDVTYAIEHIRAHGKDKETISVIYVTDDRWHLLDALSLSTFVLAPPDAKVEDIMDRTFVDVSAYSDREEAVQLMQRYDLTVLPVVDSNGVLLGIVTVDDVLDVAEAEATEDFHKGAAVAPLRGSYREATIWELFSRRIGWLLVLVFVNLVSSGVIAAYEETLAAAIALAFFIPLLIDSGGNAGAQSATLMVRAIATGDLRMSQWFRAFTKELSVGVALGVTMGFASWMLGLFRGGFEIGIVVGAAMVCIVLVANLIGTVLPFILTRLNIDPAVASSPLITSIADASGLLIYFSMATLVLGRIG